MDFNTFIEKFPIRLNEQQRSAVRAVEGPVLLLAVPGSGKTTVLVTRLGYMIYCCNIQPENILTLTYTVAATNDMRERFSSFFGARLGERMEFRTINSICAGIINYYGKQIGKKAFELLSDEKVILGMLSAIYLEIEREYPNESDLKGIRTQITYIKNRMLSEEEIKALEAEAGVHLLDIYKAYCKEMKSRGRMDFDDQMIYAYHMLRTNPGLLEHFRDMYPYICVDEAQDTSKIQHKIIALLASKTENLFMVGDEDQSIYGFRAAYPDALLSFEKDHPNARVLLMEENFRSNANIVNAAEGFIQKNTLRHEKHMRPTRKNGSEIKEIELRSRSGQYAYLAKVAGSCQSQTAVLYRDNESAIPLVDLLERERIPYRIRNAELTFFTHRIVLDIQSILRFALNMRDADLFEQIYYKISTYLTKQVALQACEKSRREGLPIFDVLGDFAAVEPHTQKNLRALCTHFRNMRGESPAKAILRIIKYMGYGEYMERSGLSDGKLFVLKTIAAKEETIEGFLGRMEELRDIIQNKENDYRCPFILSTIHASKGLEYDNVYLIDVMDGVFPEEVPKDLKHISREELQIYEEERRLFYVAATRAKENLYLFKLNNQSTFCRQLTHKVLHKEVQKELHKEIHRELHKEIHTEVHRSFHREQKKVERVEKRLNPDPLYREFIDTFAEGLMVDHKKYGRGVITAMNDNKMTILFDDKERHFSSEILYYNKLLRAVEGE